MKRMKKRVVTANMMTTIHTPKNKPIKQHLKIK